MPRPLPWLHGLERTRLASRLSARIRLYEAIWEARSSLEQFSGISVRSRDRGGIAGLPALFGRVVFGWKWAWNQGPAVWFARWRANRWEKGRSRVAAGSRTRSVPSLPGLLRTRFPVHGAILLLLAGLLSGGGFRGVLAQPVQTSSGGGDLTWQWLRSAEEPDDVLGTYTSIPAVPVALQGPRVVAPEPIVEEEVAPTATPMRSEVLTYAVQDGDYLGAIAARFNLSVETLYWFNELKSADVLSVGQELEIPPVDGLVHEVEEDDTLDSIAEEYGVRKGNMIAYASNDLREPYNLEVGQKIFVPGASKPIPQPAVTWGTRPSYVRLSAPAYAALPGGERFSWPAVGRITDRFGWTGTRWHTGVDIAAPWGTPVYAAAAGTVTFAGWKGSLGYMVEIDHGEGWETRYGHLAQQPEVSAGQWVERGQLIGFIGCTGWCTGPHLHFEVRYQGTYTDPLSYLQ